MYTALISGCERGKRPQQALTVFQALRQQVQCLHSQSPPIQHRDLKLENVLRWADGHWKVCDYVNGKQTLALVTGSVVRGLDWGPPGGICDSMLPECAQRGLRWLGQGASSRAVGKGFILL